MSSREMKSSVICVPRNVFLLPVMALLLHSLLTSTAWAERHRRVLVLYDENTDFPALALLDRSLKEALKAGAAERLTARGVAAVITGSLSISPRP